MRDYSKDCNEKDAIIPKCRIFFRHNDSNGSLLLIVYPSFSNAFRDMVMDIQKYSMHGAIICDET